MMQTQKISGEMIQNFSSVEKLKIDDDFFNTFEIEEEDVSLSIQRLKLEEDPEIVAILLESQDKMQNFIKSKEQEMQAMQGSSN